MALYGNHPSLRRDTEPIDNKVWHWFVCNGPHGERFSWHKELSTIPRDIELLREVIDESNQTDKDFSYKARIIARESLVSENPILVCKAIQVLSVIGEEVDFIQIKEFVESPDKNISVNAKCCLFENGIKIKKSKT